MNCRVSALIDTVLNISGVQAGAKKGYQFEYSRLISAKKSGPATACRSASTQQFTRNLATFLSLYHFDDIQDSHLRVTCERGFPQKNDRGAAIIFLFDASGVLKIAPSCFSPLSSLISAAFSIKATTDDSYNGSALQRRLVHRWKGLLTENTLFSRVGSVNVAVPQNNKYQQGSKMKYF